MSRAPCRKRPCKVCHRWFLPDPRVGQRQKTCASPDCQRIWHRRQCAKWNRANKEYFKANYLQKKLADCSDSCPRCVGEKSGSHRPTLLLPASRVQLHLPRSEIAEVITPKALIIIDYIVVQLAAKIQSTRKKTVLGSGRAKLPVANNSP